MNNLQKTITMVVLNMICIGAIADLVSHDNNQKEVEWLSGNAYRNRFYGSTLEEYQPEMKETFEYWREQAKDKLKELENESN